MCNFNVITTMQEIYRGRICVESVPSAAVGTGGMSQTERGCS